MAIYGWSWRCSFHFSSLLTIKISDCRNVYINAFHVPPRGRTWFVPTTSMGPFQLISTLSFFLTRINEAPFSLFDFVLFSWPVTNHLTTKQAFGSLATPIFERVNDESMIDKRTPDPMPKVTTSESRLVSYDDYLFVTLFGSLTPGMRMEG